MKILLGSGGVGTDERKAMYQSLMSENFSDCDKVAFVPYASDAVSYTHLTLPTKA